ncbi:sushi, von Willebrand factor type A, EGF and pentraxin domain-containing protein 1-like [Dendronephthya gigantea]|uniref:sushi, von Willebrand factor type A, EGF and pentraxin domain-containing protein 1-like n=1 Tax=Dendronephthya gigantea TaxID=151771 RepID=UPI00106D67C1|nr:sushi, von Willebrand factor type A, EGF and pentraxin domain-containing protein 1-like [Dendronephthya gigantea]
MALLMVIFALLFISKLPKPGECLDLSQAVFQKIEQRYLKNHVIDKKQARDEVECVMYCLENESCASVNFKISGKLKGLCELNNSTLTDISGIRNPEYNHLYKVEKKKEDFVPPTFQPHTAQISDDSRLTGFRLNSSILKKTNVSSKAECISSCIKEPCCRSLNYKESSPQAEASVCEMLHDVIHNTSKQLQENSFYDYIYFKESQKVYNERCTKKGDYDLKFESAQNFTLLDQNVPKMSNMTLMFWMNTLKADEITVFSYRTREGAEEFMLKMKKERIILEVQSLKKYFFIPPINDGYWHHVAVTWSLGIYSVSLDGILVYSGDGLSSGKPLKNDGVFVIESSFSGKLSQLNVWSDLKSATADLDINSTTQSCLTDEVGNVINWRSLKDSYHGCVVGIELISSCKPLRKNPDYDFIMVKPSSIDVNKINLGNISSLEAFTITTWLKHEERTQYDSKSMEYVDYRNANGTKLVSLYFAAEYFILKIIGTFASCVLRK